jgi:cysteine synthase
MSVVESTSGNLGFSLAILSKKYKFKLICVIDPKCPKKNIDFYQAYGCEIVMVDKKDATGGYQKNRIAVAKQIESSRDNCLNLDQYNNYDAQEVHYETTGPEIYKQMDGEIGSIISCVSTGSHLSGIAKYLKEQNKNIKTVAVEPVGSVVFGGIYEPYQQNGSGLSFTPRNYNKKYIDYEIKVSDNDAFSTVKKVIDSDGLLVGSSSGAVLFAAKKLSLIGNSIVIIADSGQKYLNTLEFRG